MTNRIGSWPFIIVQSVILLIWIVVNTIAWRQHWDPYPFILLNLVLSFQAAYAAPIIMMSQNRQSAKDREKAEADYAVNARAERDVAAVHARLDELAGLQWATLVDMQQRQLELLTRIETLTREVHRVTIPHDPARESSAATELMSAELTPVARYRRATNYLAAAQIYLQDNVLLDEPLRPTHIKDRLLGHWGTCPGINLVYAHLNRLIRERDANILLITGPGHGAAANLANLYLEGTLSEFYPELTRDRNGLERFVRAFSWPGGFPSHLSPPVPGTIHEGGELGYALATAFGAALDNPDLIVACIVGDGEAETGPTATAWHSTKFLDPATSGAVLPILHLNGFKISSPTIFATMSDAELTDLFAGYGYAPHIVDVDTAEDPDAVMAEADGSGLQGHSRHSAGRAQRERRTMALAGPADAQPQRVDRVQKRSTACRSREHSALTRCRPRTPAQTRPISPSSRRGSAPIVPRSCSTPTVALSPISSPRARPELQRIGMNPHTRGWQLRRELDLPPLADFALPVSGPGETTASALERAGTYLAEVLRRSETERNFRIVCPDETTSNLLGARLCGDGPGLRLAGRGRRLRRMPTLSPTGRVMEILSEHTCQGLAAGLPPDRPPWALSLLRGLRHDRRFDGQPVRQMAQDVGRDTVARAGSLAHLSLDL